jgi:glutathione S-transferase
MCFAFPNELKAREDDYPLMFTKFYPGVKQQRGIKEYVSSGRRLGFNQRGVFRHYPELDRS